MRPDERNGPRDDGEPAHDVLAAEEFAIPAATRSRHRGPVVLPDDPTGINAPHDVLAAEEFAMPAAGRAVGLPTPGISLPSRTSLLGGLGLGALLAAVLRRRRS
jgi:hypothetical protein